MSHESPEQGAPWYVQFWPWFIVGLLTVSVVGSLFTVAIAYRARDTEIRREPFVEAGLDELPSDATLDSREP